MRSSIRGKGEEGSPGAKGGAGQSADNNVPVRGAPGNRVGRGGQCPLAQFSSWSPDFGLMLQRGRGTHRHEPFGRKETGCLDFGTGVGRT